MKKVLLTFSVLGLLLGTTSCRESTGDKAEDTIESAVEDAEDNLEQVGDEIQELGNDIDKEIEEETTNADDN
jgi:vacuolar-type H+-ATPase subunit H